MRLLPSLALAFVAGSAGCALNARRPAPEAHASDGEILISAAEIAELGVQTAWDVVKRKAPQISYRENSAGEPARAWRHGRGSVVLNESPMLVVDGVRIADLRVMDQIPAATVEFIRILTGLSGTTYYGTNAASGVILIQTRSGS